MTRTNENEGRAGGKATCSVVVVYEHDTARERAVAFCDQLVGKFWALFEFDVSWWSFALLDKAASATEAAGKAASADVVAFAISPEGDLPRPVKDWMETWLTQRGECEGILVGLLGTEIEGGEREVPKHHYLRQAAHRGSMDYLTQVPQDMARAIPDSLDSYTQRADQVTGLLDGILHQQVPPHLLI